MQSDREIWWFVTGKGFLLALIIFGLGMFLIGTLYSLWDGLDGGLAASTLLFINYLAVFMGGFWAGRSSDRGGWQKGLIIGIGYASLMLIWARGSLDVVLHGGSLIRLGLMMATGMLGGILGVNFTRR